MRADRSSDRRPSGCDFSDNTEHQDEPGKVLADNREIFEFTDREKNATLLQKISDVVWRKEFIPFDPPNDWKTIEVPYAPPAAEDFRAAGVTPSGFAPNSQPIPIRR